MPDKKCVSIQRLPQFSNSEKADIWKTIENEVTSILNTNKLNMSLEELYRSVENLHSLNYLPLLYNLQMVIEAHLMQKLDIILMQDVILPVLNDFWKEFYTQIVTIKNIFLCIDRSSKQFKYNTVQSISLNLFTNVVILNPIIKNKLISNLLIQIDWERNGNNADTTLLRSITEMLNHLQVYDEIFETELLKQSQFFYEAEATRLIDELTIPHYLQHASNRITQEKGRVERYINPKTEQLLIDIVLREFIEKHIDQIFFTGFETLIENQMLDELHFVFYCSQRIQYGLKFLVGQFRDFILKRGVAITDSKNEKNMVQDLLDLKHSMDAIIDVVFKNGDIFYECLRSAFENFINTTSGNISNIKIAQLLAKYVDGKLRSKELADDDELNVILDKVIVLFKYIQGKDIFGAFYKKYLSTRLLLGKSSSQDAEHSMILKLKHECGPEFTSNLEGMFQDISLSRTINLSFKQRCLKSNSHGGDLTVNVLTSSYWPNYTNFNVNLPAELIDYQESFQKFYLSNHSGRKLLWQPSLGHCIVRAQFECGTKELQVSLFQTVVLLLFNNAHEIPYKDIQEATNLTENELNRTLWSLINGKCRILLKQPPQKPIANTDLFMINAKFTDKLFRVKINQIQLQETVDDEKETVRNVIVDRQFQIDAAIVRIMKNKKTIKHNQLVGELYKVLDIPVNKSDLKKRIEMLIEREYMERDKDSYIYIA